MQLGPIAEWGLNLIKTISMLTQKTFKQIKKVYLLSETFVLTQEKKDLFYQDFMKQHWHL